MQMNKLGKTLEDFTSVLFERTMDVSNGASSLSESFLAAGQYIVHAEDGDETLGISGDSMDSGGKDRVPLREQDRFVPIANVSRIMKNAIPKSGKIAKEAKECVQECVSEFVSFITSEYPFNDRCLQEKRKTINGEDILFAMSTLGFDNYVEPLKLYLQKYRESMKGGKTISTATATDSHMDDLEDSSYSSQTLTAAMMTDQSGQNVLYTTAYPAQDLNLLLYNNQS
ncbi:nuclear transcription factor Y subunit beta [Caerostris darwini]|uniref:Nuclear transcription factor Y subunit beta n=2 Tax=Caerostris darwini TaxID=1538125 RepID=A0AAV4RQC5_9ARAC|nr:nuclear transcription factor Y subunit beta [Caerostris darwini]